MATTSQPVLANLLEYFRTCVAQQDYEVLGQMMLVETDHGRISFTRETGPWIAQVVETRDQLRTERKLYVLISEWNPFPTLRNNTEEFCPHCLAMCDVCNGAMKITCTAAHCGGTGKVAVSPIECPDCAAKDGRFNPQCTTCRGSGSVKQEHACVGCNGTGKADCGACRGQGKRPTGYQGGSRERTAATCSTCRGTLRAGVDVEQDYKKFVHRTKEFPDGRWDGYAIIGPIRSFLLTPTALPGEATIPRVVQVNPDAGGNMMVFLVKDPGQKGSEAYALGGILK